ncbi:MAG: hypothetical protein AVDCRST_MAG41-1725, partial [uncultured Corynebacteriales bacterium]
CCCSTKSSRVRECGRPRRRPHGCGSASGCTLPASGSAGPSAPSDAPASPPPRSS